MGQARLLAVAAAAHSSQTQEDAHRLAPQCSATQLKPPLGRVRGQQCLGAHNHLENSIQLDGLGEQTVVVKPCQGC